MSVEIRHLRYFLAVAEELHFTRAAERLHLAQPALSSQIKKLETTLRVQLLHRSTRFVELTQAGEGFLVKARAAVVAYDDALTTASQLRTGESGHIRFGINPRTRTSLRLRVLQVMQGMNPNVTMDITTGGSAQLVESVLEGHLDAALCLAPAAAAGLRSMLIRQEPMFAALPESHPLTHRDSLVLTDLRDEMWLLPSARVFGSNSTMQQRCREHGFEMRVALATSDYDDDFTLVAGGHGVEVIPDSFIRSNHVSGVAFVPLEEETMPLRLITRADNDAPALGQVFTALRSIAEEEGWLTSD